MNSNGMSLLHSFSIVGDSLFGYADANGVNDAEVNDLDGNRPCSSLCMVQLVWFAIWLFR
jgi:hypothetical protein